MNFPKILTIAVLGLAFVSSQAQIYSSSTLFSDDYVCFQEVKDSLLDFAHLHLGKPYKYAAKGPNSFDCSGFTYYVFSNFGYKLGASSKEQFTKGLEISLSDLQKGDLVFFGGSRNRSVGHVGIVVSTDTVKQSFKFIHAASSRGIRIDEYPSEPYYAKRYRGARRMFLDKGFQVDFLTDTSLLSVREDSLYRVQQEASLQSSKLSSLLLDTSPVNVATDFAQGTSSQGTSIKIAVGSMPQTESQSSHSAQAEQLEESSPSPKYYKVKAGDTLYRIAKEHGCSVQELKKWNRLSSNTLSIGRKLKLQP